MKDTLLQKVIIGRIRDLGAFRNPVEYAVFFDVRLLGLRVVGTQKLERFSALRGILLFCHYDAERRVIRPAYALESDNKHCRKRVSKKRQLVNAGTKVPNGLLESLLSRYRRLPMK